MAPVHQEKVSSPYLRNKGVESLGPGTHCCSACSWTNIFFSDKIQRNYKGLKITAYMHSWGKLWTISFWRARSKTESKTKVSEAKAGYCECLLQSTQWTGWADHLSHPSCPNSGHSPTLTPWKQPACPLLGSKQGNCYLFSLTPCCSNKALPEFLVWPLVNFCWLRKTKNPDQ